MMVQSPLKRHDVQPNLRKVPVPDSTPSPLLRQATTSKQAKRAKKTSGAFPKPKASTIVLATLIIGVLGFIYITHVFATQRLLREVQHLEAEYNKARQQHDELKLRYERLIGPAEIYQKAKQLGFINGGPADHIIIIEE